MRRAGTPVPQFLSAVAWKARTGRAWRQLPAGCGPWRSVHARFVRWCDQGVWEHLHTCLATDPALRTLYLADIVALARPHRALARPHRALTLRRALTRSLRSQGFRVQRGQIQLPASLDKEQVRQLHALAVAQRIALAAPSLQRREPDLQQHLAAGSEVDPAHVHAYLVEVQRGSEEELLFRYAACIGVFRSLPVTASACASWCGMPTTESWWD